MGNYSANSHAGGASGLSQMEQALHNGNLMVWEAGPRQPGIPPPGYGPLAMGPAALAFMPEGFTLPEQVKGCASCSVQRRHQLCNNCSPPRLARWEIPMGFTCRNDPGSRIRFGLSQATTPIDRRYRVLRDKLQYDSSSSTCHWLVDA